MAPTKEDRVAQTILDQIGQMTLMGMGAHKVERYLDAVRFKIKAIVPGTRQARIMQVQIALTPQDLYNVRIGFMKKLDYVMVEDLSDVYAETMVETMRKYS